MKIKKGKSFAIYVSSKVNDNVLEFLNKQKNVSESIISIVEEYIRKQESDNLKSLSKRVLNLEEIVIGSNKKNFKNHFSDDKISGNNSEPLEEDSSEDDDMELLFKQLNE